MPSADSYEALIRQAKETEPLPTPKKPLTPQPDRSFRPGDVNPVAGQPGLSIPGSGSPANDPALTAVREARVQEHPLWTQKVAENTVIGLASFPMLTEQQAKAVAEVMTTWSIDDPELSAMVDEDFQQAMVEAWDAGSGIEGSPARELFGEALGIVQEVATYQQQEDRRARLNAIYAQATSPTEKAAAVLASGQAETDNWLGRRLLSFGKAAIIDGVTMGLFDAGRATTQATLDSAIGNVLTEEEKEEIRTHQRARVSPVIAAASMVNLVMQQHDLTQRDAAREVLSAMEGLSEEERNSLQRNIAEFTADEIIEQAEAEGDPFESSMDRSFEEFFDQTVMTMALWDGVSQAIAVEITSLVAEIPGAELFPDAEDRPTIIQQMLDGDTEGAKESYFELVAEGAGGWFGMEEGPGRAWVNILAGGIFDPLNLFTGGGAKVAGNVAEALARNPEQILKHPGFKGIVKNAVEAGQENALAITLLGDNLSTRAKAQIMATTNPEEVTEILLRELTDGYYVPDPSFMMQRRHTAIGLGQAASHLGDNKVADFLVEFLTRSRYNRTVNTGEAHVTQEIEQLVLFRYGNDQEAAAGELSRWYDIANEQQASREVARTEAITRSEQLELELTELEDMADSGIGAVPWLEEVFNPQGEPGGRFRLGIGDDLKFTEEAMAHTQKIHDDSVAALPETIENIQALQQQLDGAAAIDISNISDDFSTVGEVIGAPGQHTQMHRLLAKVVNEIERSMGPEYAGMGIWFHGSGVGQVSDNPSFRSDIGFFTTNDLSYATGYMGRPDSKLFAMFPPPFEETVELTKMVDGRAPEAVADLRSNIEGWLAGARESADTPEAVAHLDMIEQIFDIWDGLWDGNRSLTWEAVDNTIRKVSYAMADFDAGRYKQAIIEPDALIDYDDAGDAIVIYNEFGDEITIDAWPKVDVNYEHWDAPDGAFEKYWEVLFPGKKGVYTDEGAPALIWKNPPEEIMTSAEASPQFDALFQAFRTPGILNQLERDVVYHTNLVDMAKETLEFQKGVAAEWATRREAAQQALAEQRRLLEELDRPRDRNWVYDHIKQFYDEWADAIDAPRLPNGEVDWGMIRSGESSRFVRPGMGDEVDRLSAVAIDEDHKRVLDASGALQGGSKYQLPASPYHMTLWANTPKADRPKLIELLKRAAGGTEQTLRFMNRIFAASVLLNFVTPIKSAMDEVIRFGQEAAGFRGFFKAAESTFRQNVDNPRAVASSREVINPLTHTSDGWVMVEPGTPEHVHAAERWLNGTIRQSPIYREAARAIQANDLDGFIKWWDEVGSGGEVRMVAISVEPGKPPTPVSLTGEMVFDAINASLDLMGSQAKNPKWKSQILRYLADNEEIPLPLARQTGPVPGQQTQSTGIAGGAFDTLYGRPSQRRHSLFFDHRYKYLQEIYNRRFEGRIADEQLDLLVEAGLAEDLTHARQIFEQRHPQVDEFFRDRGMATRGYIDESAAESAGRWADDMMYTMGGVSRAGRSAQLISPFAPAQFDFMSWWARELTRYTDFMLPFSGAAGAAARKLPGKAGELLGKYAQAKATAPIPLNLRLMSRMTHLPVSSERDDNPTKWEPNPTDIIETFTFLPMRWDADNFLLDFGPGVGPLPNWMINMLPSDHPIRETLSSFFPAVDFLEGQSFDPRRHFLPSSSRSLPGIFQLATRGATALDGGDGLMTDFFQMIGHSLLAHEQKPYGYSDFLKSTAAQKFLDDPFWDPALDPEGTVEMINQTMADASSAEAMDRLMAMTGFRPQFGADGLNPAAYYGMVDSLEFLEEFGIVGSAQADELRELREQIIESGGTDHAQIRFFAESARELLFGLEDEWQDYALVKHPEVAVNMVSTVQCARDDTGQSVGPEEYCRPDGTVNFTVMPPGLEGDRIRRQGAEAGWWGPRDDMSILRDMSQRVADARRRMISTIYEAATGTNWPGVDRISDKVANSRYQFSPFHLEMLEASGVQAENGMTGRELAVAVDEARDRLPQPPVLIGSDSPLDRFMLRSPDLQPYRTWIEGVEAEARRAGHDSPYDWPDEAKEAVREVYAEAAILDPEIQRYYTMEAQRFFGPLDFEAVVPPSVDELQVSWNATPNQVAVVDADTIRLTTRRGDFRMRVIGINAPEQGQVGYLESKDSLMEVIRNADEITFGLHRPELFGTSQVVTPEGEKRLIAWLYIDGVPLYDPANFTATNPQGIDIGGDPIDVVELLRQRQQERAGE